MKYHQVLQYVCRNQSFLSLRKFLESSCNLKAFLLDLDGQAFCRNGDCQKTVQVMLPRCQGRIPFELEGEFIEEDSLGAQSLVSMKHLNEAGNTQDVKMIFSNHHVQQILIPLLIKNNVIGYVLFQKDQGAGLLAEAAESIVSFCRDFLKGLLKAEFEFSECLDVSTLTHQQRIIHDVVQYIHENYHVPDLSLKDIAQKKGISYHYLSRLFKQEVKVSFACYRNQFRVKKAIKLLKVKSLLVHQISFHCGFEDPGYFSKAFKISVGVSPQAYREKFLSLNHGREKKGLEGRGRVKKMGGVSRKQAIAGITNFST